MTKKDKEYLIKKLESAVREVIKVFEEKQELNFEFFVGDDVTGFACFGCVFYFNISDIWLDLVTEQPKGRIIDWLYYCLEERGAPINYNSYTMTQKK